MISFSALAASENASNDSSESLTNGAGASPLEIKQRVLQKKLKRLKREVDWYKRETDTLRNNKSMLGDARFSAVSGNDAIVKALLSSNDSAVHETLVEELQEREKWKLEKEEDRYDVFYPVRTGETASFLTSLFHSLNLTTATRISSNEIHVTHIKGHCTAPTIRKYKLFTFTVELGIFSGTHSVDFLTVNLNSWVKGEIGHYMAVQQHKKDVYRVMHGLAQYSNACIRRFAVFEALKQKYQCGDSLWRRSSRIMIVLNNETNFGITFQWKLSISPTTDEIVSHIAVYFNRPLSSLNSPAALESLPDVFSSLLDRHGVYKAFCIIHDLITTSTTNSSYAPSRESSVSSVS